MRFYDFYHPISYYWAMENARDEKTFFEKESSFRTIFNYSNEGIFVVDNEGIIHLVNPVCEKMFGYPTGDLKGENVDLLVPVSLRGRHHTYREKYKQDPKPRSMGIGRDLLGQRKDGSQFPLEVSLSKVTISDREYVVVFVIDISARKKVEEKLKRSEEQLITYATELEHRVNKRTQDLDRTILQLEEMNLKLQSEVKERQRAEEEARQSLAKERDLNELKSRFVSMASHEFRTPLSSILSSVSLIQKYIEVGQTDKTLRHIERVKGSVKNLTDILNDFLSLGRLEEGKIQLLKQRISLGEYIQQVLSDLDGILKPGQKYQYETISLPIDITVDEKLLKNILTNLLSNATKYSPENSQILLSIEEQEEQVKIHITDYGMGIPAEEQIHMFERFFRAKNATNIQGTGLGLNIVKKYVDLLHGTISFVSQLGKGTTFTLSLPKNSYNEKDFTD
ncbi:MAG: PAS domain-containing sensor histidine kinase [Cyclobacteriaceae bacterium]|nr:PAS domain-containing sensor histidine kinase [Cyclobacteriaceae bacterium]